MKATARVFKDQDGNRMMFPAYIYRDDEEIETLSDQSMMIKLSTGLEMENELYVFDDEVFPHFKTRVGSAGFAHGSESVYLFDGPEFDALKNYWDEDDNDESNDDPLPDP